MGLVNVYLCQSTLQFPILPKLSMNSTLLFTIKKKKKKPTQYRKNKGKLPKQRVQAKIYQKIVMKRNVVLKDQVDNQET